MKYKTYKGKEVEKFMEDNFIDFECDETLRAIEIIAKKQTVNLSFKANKINEDKSELIIRIELNLQ